MKTKVYQSPFVEVFDSLTKNGLMDFPIGGSGGDVLSNEASVKPFEDEEDENEARRNHEVWDDEE